MSFPVGSKFFPDGIAIQLGLTPIQNAATTGQIKVWNGSAWVAKPIKVWDGAAWVAKSMKYYNGSTFVVTNY